MLDQIINFAKDQLGDQFKTDNNLDDNQQAEVFSTAQSSIMDTIKNQIGGGNLGGLMNLFNGQDDASPQANPIAGEAQQNVIASLMDKLGLDEGKASGIASQIIPAVMQRFSSPETGTAENPMDLVKKIGLDGDSGIADMIGKFTGGEGSVMDKIKNLF
jgi:flagellar hook-associated protein FlgK